MNYSDDKYQNLIVKITGEGCHMTHAYAVGLG